MHTSKMNPKADFFFTKAKQWQQEYEQLRSICLDSGLDENVKWGCPCYTLDDNNIVLIHGFKEYCALLLFKGAVMKDPKGILIQQTENVQSARQLRFTSADQILKMTSTIKAYIKEAIRVEKSGIKVPMKKTQEFDMPDAFKEKLSAMPALKKAFEALTPGRQRGYLLYFSQAKQAKTLEARIEKSMQAIFDGKGLND